MNKAYAIINFDRGIFTVKCNCVNNSEYGHSRYYFIIDSERVDMSNDNLSDEYLDKTNLARFIESSNTNYNIHPYKIIEEVYNSMKTLYNISKENNINNITTEIELSIEASKATVLEIIAKFNINDLCDEKMMLKNISVSHEDKIILEANSSEYVLDGREVIEHIENTLGVTLTPNTSDRIDGLLSLDGSYMSLPTGMIEKDEIDVVIKRTIDIFTSGIK